MSTPGATRIELDVRVPARGVHLALSPRPGRTTAVIGPNGAGKSTMLEAISGMLGGVDGVRLDGREAGRLAPHRRRIGYLPQQAPLFEHLDVTGNVAFGPRAQGASRAAARARAAEVLAQVGAADLAGRRPRELSGGQARRVAIARALAASPGALLLDEPFAALDADVTGHLRALLGELLAGRTALLVTHDLLDVLALADNVAALEGGTVVACGEREEILARPPTAFVARLTGRVMLTGRLDGDGVVTDDGTRLRGAVDADTPAAHGARVHALVDPARVSLRDGTAGATETAPPAGAVVVRAPLETIVREGSGLVVRAGGIAAQLDPERAVRALPRAGERIELVVPPEAVRIYAGAHDAERPEPR